MWENIFYIFDIKRTILKVYIESWLLNTTQLGQNFEHSGQYLGRKLGNFFLLFPPITSLYSQTQFLLCSMQSLMFMIYCSSSSKTSILTLHQRRKQIDLFSLLYCHHIHPLTTLSDRKHVQHIIWKVT